MKNAKRLLLIAMCFLVIAGTVSVNCPDAYAKTGTVYTFGNTEGPWRDLAAEHKAEFEQKAKQEQNERVLTEQLKKTDSAKKPVKITRRPVKTCPKE